MRQASPETPVLDLLATMTAGSLEVSTLDPATIMSVRLAALEAMDAPTVAWRDLLEGFGPWQTVWKRHRRFSSEGTWDRIHARSVAEADAAGEVHRTVSVDSMLNRGHRHATNMSRAERPAGVHTGGRVALHQPGRRAWC